LIHLCLMVKKSHKLYQNFTKTLPNSIFSPLMSQMSNSMDAMTARCVGTPQRQWRAGPARPTRQMTKNDQS
jgi:hypothetical protein